MGVGRGIFLQLLRLSRETGPGHVGGRQGGRREWGGTGGGGGRSLRRANPRPISRKTAGGRVLETARTLARPARHAPLPPRLETPRQAGGRSARGAGPQRLGAPGVVRWMRRGEMSERCLSPWSPKD